MGGRRISVAKESISSEIRMRESRSSFGIVGTKGCSGLDRSQGLGEFTFLSACAQ